ncbi:MAG: RNA polymerase subunit sigma-24, partial [Pseudohongiella sp.]
QAQIADGVQCLNRALRQGPAGVYTLQAAIAALHAQAPRYQDTDWPQIVGLYDALYRLSPSPVIALNRAVAVAMCEGPETGLQLVDELATAGKLERYHLLHAARADFYRRLGHTDAARDAYEKALALTEQAPERAFLQARLAALTDTTKKI